MFFWKLFVRRFNIFSQDHIAITTFETPCLTKLETRARSVKRVFDMIENADTIRESLYFEDKILVLYGGGAI